MIKEIVLCKKEDFINRFTRYPNFKTMYVEPDVPLTENKWTYDYNKHLFKVNVGSNVQSYVVIEEDKFNVGDSITVEFSIYSNASFYICEYELKDETTNKNLKTGNYALLDDDLNKWKKCKFTIPITQKCKLKLSIGASSSQIAEYSMKPIKVTFNKLEDSSSSKSIDIKKFAIKKVNGSWTINNEYSSNNATFSSSGKALTCDFSTEPFLGDKKPIVNITFGEKGFLYETVLFGAYNNKVLLNFYDRKDMSTSIDNSKVVDNTEIFITMYQ